MTGTGRNEKVYIHEFIDITKQNRARYMHHMTANWSPIGQEQRGQLCYGVWGVVGSTGPWPQVVNIWEHDGFDGLAASFRHEVEHPGMQDPALAKWWAAAADLRSGGFDRIVVPHPTTRTISELCAAGVRGEVYAHELVGVDPGLAGECLDAAVAGASVVTDRHGWVLAGAWRTAMGDDSECILLWAIPTWDDWAALERTGGAALTLDGPPVRRRHRMLLVDAPLSPFRTGRQPSRADRTDWTD